MDGAPPLGLDPGPAGDPWEGLGAPSSRVKLQVALWSEILNLGWKNGQVDIVFRASRYLLKQCWHPRKSSFALELQAKGQCILAQALAATIEHTPDRLVVPPTHRGLSHSRSGTKESPADQDGGPMEAAQKNDDGLDEVLTDEQQKARATEATYRCQLGVERPSCPQRLRFLKGKIVGALVGAIRRGLRLATASGDADTIPEDILAGGGGGKGGTAKGGGPEKMPAAVASPELFSLEPWQAYGYVVENAVVLLWNLHLDTFLRGEWAALIPELLEALRVRYFLSLPSLAVKLPILLNSSSRFRSPF